jgi:Tol biopolymer transport system component
VPDPRGGEVAFVEGICTDSYENEHLVVRNLRTGAQWSIGVDAKVCHSFSPPAWNPSGTRLVFAYAPSLVTSSTDEPGLGEGGCLAPAAGALVTVAAGASSSTTAWHHARADSGCSYSTAVFDAWGVAAVETCGSNSLGDAYLVQLTSSLERVALYVLAPGSNPSTLSASPSGALVLIDEYESTGGGNSGVPEDTVVPAGMQPGPYIWVETFDGKGLHVIRRWGNIFVNLWGITW